MTTDDANPTSRDKDAVAAGAGPAQQTSAVGESVEVGAGGVNKKDSNTNADSANDGNQQELNKGKAVRDVALYAFLRLLLFLVLTFVIHSIVILLGMANYFPLLVSMTLALILALPLSMVMFKNLRLRVTEQVARWDANRKAHKQELRDQLRERLDD